MVILHDEEYYRSRIPRPDLGPFGNFLRFIWDKERKAFLDRTAKEWGQLGVFYLCFYTVLGFIFGLQMKISLDYISEMDKPFFQYPGLSSAFRNTMRLPRSAFASPGIVFKPNSISAASPIISVSNLTSSTRPERHIQALTDFLQEYHKSLSDYDLNCHDKHASSSNGGKPCYFDIEQLGKCSKPPYGYTKPLQPCVLIKFNKRFDWIPEYYNHTSTLPESMPTTLKRAIHESRKSNVWLSCDGANNVDKDHIGEIEYIPSPGFPIQFFPFTGQSGYLSPVVALEFKNLTPNILVTVECQLWAFNIEQRSRNSLDFQIIIRNTMYAAQPELSYHSSNNLKENIIEDSCYAPIFKSTDCNASTHCKNELIGPQHRAMGNLD
ncbi:sodium/potassium-transporting ATPase subunit beta-1-like [Lasioglossum baleicum]|uniref:sodium/potassium-transporting ATPase subunit beta-1-like n=1 Tax=Lasioglossum baleicum TaxID=434251 RepID=UPI003FCC6281